MRLQPDRSPGVLVKRDMKKLLPEGTIFVGWGMYLASMFMVWTRIFDSARGTYGWEESAYLFINLYRVLHLIEGDVLGRLMALLPFINVAMILSPLAFFLVSKGRWGWYWAICAISSLLVLTITLVAYSSVGVLGLGNQLGYYLWSMSVWVVTVGLYLMSRHSVAETFVSEGRQ